MVPRAAHHGNNPLADTPLKTEEKVEALEFDGHLTESMNHSSTPIEQKPLEKEEVPEIARAAELVNDATSEQRIDRPKKKTRWVLDCVMLSTWADLQRQKKKQEEKDLQMMNTIKNVRKSHFVVHLLIMMFLPAEDQKGSKRYGPPTQHNQVAFRRCRAGIVRHSARKTAGRYPCSKNISFEYVWRQPPGSASANSRKVPKFIRVQRLDVSRH